VSVLSIIVGTWGSAERRHIRRDDVAARSAFRWLGELKRPGHAPKIGNANLYSGQYPTSYARRCRSLCN